MKNKLLALAGIPGAVLAFGIPAAADAPSGFTDAFEFQEPDPCNPEVIQTTEITRHVRVHEHGNNVVWTSELAVETDSGYIGSGRQTTVVGTRRVVDSLTATVRNPEGDSYQVNVHITETPSGIVAETFNVRCTGSA